MGEQAEGDAFFEQGVGEGFLFAFLVGDQHGFAGVAFELDGAAFALARENRLPIIVFSMADKGAVEKVLRGEGRSTLVG